jgi:hypothetical protein
MPTPGNPFLGIWVLEPKLCRYEQDEPPARDTYIVAEEAGGAISFTVDGAMADGSAMRFRYSAVADGKPHPLEGFQAADSLTVILTDELLETVAFRGGSVTGVARRTLSEDRSMMTVTQEWRGKDGKKSKNVSVYRRAG